MATILTNQQIEYESAQTAVAFFAMTNSGDATTFTSGSNNPWSRATGYEPVFAPYGLLTGGTVIPAVAAGNNNVDTDALTAMMPGVSGASATTGILSVNASTNNACARGSSTNTHIINSITVSTAGAIAVVSGTASTAFSATRNAAGGPPFIPDGAIEIAQVKFTSTAAAVVAAGEIYQVVGDSQERSDFPVYSPDYLRGKLTFASALPLIHTGSIPKRVYVKCATPVFAPIANARDWVPATESYSVNSEAYYDQVIGSSSSSIGQATFTAALNDGTSDGILSKLGQLLLFRFKPNKNSSTVYQITQGILAVATTFGVKAAPQGRFTISPSQATVRISS